ncbi:MAG TPA: YtxH domain-containing protein [Oscillatoriaceae cyanobacterium]
MGRIGAFLVGGILGATAAMLLAPRSGQETRDELRNRAGGLRDQYGDLVERSRLRATELVKTGREAVDQAIAQGQQMANQAAQTARGTVDTQADRATQGVNQTAQKAQNTLENAGE